VSVPRLYLDLSLAEGMQTQLDTRCHKHAIQVLRLKEGEGAQLIIFNGQGGEYQATLEEVKQHQSAVRLNRYLDLERESALRLELVQAITRSVHMDYCLQKSVELGVSPIQPVFTRRSLTIIGSKHQQKKYAH